MPDLIRRPASGLDAAETVITELDTEGFGLRFSLVRIPAGEAREVHAEHETAYLLMTGSLTVRAGELSASHARGSLFDERPFVLHVCQGTQVVLRAEADVELCRVEAEGDAIFAPRVYHPDDTREEQRGKGNLHDAAFRFVRTVVDDRNGPSHARIVLGEVVTLPGRWSSYPPHHHPQPEIYHYRFTDPRGYGHAEKGDDVFKVKDGDTLLIPPGQVHSQCAAPGYGMWYVWAIRHLDDRRYTTPEFEGEHAWILDKDASCWWPRGEG